MKKKVHSSNPHLVLAAGFLAAIVVGAVLLACPFARTAGNWGGIVDSLFTACSAVCVTGLAVMDTGREFTVFGQSVLMCLVELGGLGVMTFGTFLLVVAGRRLSLESESSLMSAYGFERTRGLRQLAIAVVGVMLLSEALGAVGLWYAITRGEPCFKEALFNSKAWFEAVFYSVTGFCNAGFTLSSDSLIGLSNNNLFVWTIAALCFTGGIGFLVIVNLFTVKFWCKNRKSRGNLSLHSKTVLAVTAILVIGGTAGFLLLEHSRTLSGLGWGGKTAGAFLQTVVSHTAGFTTVSMSESHPTTHLLTEALMFVGGSPGSTAGGIKTTTFAVLVCTLAAMCRGRRETTLFKRTLSVDVVRESIVIVMCALLLICLAFGVLLVTENGRPGCDFDKLLFETVSAVTTTGLSLGATPCLSPEGKCIVMVCMFLGRLGAISAVMMIGRREDNRLIKYPAGELVVG